MFGYATVGSTDFDVSPKFYDALLGALGYSVTHDYSQGGRVGYGDPALTNQPRERTLWPTFYIAYIRDLIGNKFSCVTHNQE